MHIKWYITSYLKNIRKGVTKYERFSNVFI